MLKLGEPSQNPLAVEAELVLYFWCGRWRFGGQNVPDELMTFRSAQIELRAETEELHAIIAAGNLRTFKCDDMVMLYANDVREFKKGRTTGASAHEAGQLSFEEALSELQMATGELRALIDQGELRAFNRDGELRFRRTDVLDLKKSIEHL